MKRWIVSLALAICAACSPHAAEAHLANTRLGDFYGGALHPLTSFEYLLPWLALAILAAFQGAVRGRWLLAVFPLGLLAGSALSLLLPGLAIVAFLNIALVAALGLLVTLGIVIPFSAFITLAAFAGLGQGYDNVSGMTPGTNPALFVAGVCAVGYAFAALAGAGALAFLGGSGGWRPVTMRAAGSWIAAVGIMILGFRLLTGEGAS